MQIDQRVSKQAVDMQLVNNTNTSDAQVSGSDFAGLITQVAQQQAEPAVQGAMTQENGLLWLQLGSARGASSYPVQLNSAVQPAEEFSLPSTFDALISGASRKYGVSESLIKAVIDTESSFNPNAVSSAGAKGLMQLMDATAQGLGVNDPFDPAENIDAGVRYLSYQLKRFGGQENMALAAYNAGPSRVERLGISSDAELMSVLDQLPVETQNYVAKIQIARAKFSG
ncbi:lytic transglycosylase domain-containing protein [Paenibacillus sp. P96]|uniref:Lytic transglycosylase domain-containing protein n=1 Tax=Paenibacillus zeirhizosphaerae TaxID=2987519 RepID=A0ABT9FQG1_9BACL|nr:lytic transglycosylase domain-containing protein [Paenibacillus sp. P96]MDP4096964.1 lytic transglycosylase domain-containing protein [Paenibacillus sp. P96]